MRKFLLGISVLFVIVSISFEADAQLSRKSIRKNNKRMGSFKGIKNKFNRKYNYIGITLNSFNYFGDISPLPKRISTDISFTKPAIGVTFGHRFGPRYTLRGEFRYGGLSGSDFEIADPNTEDSKYRYIRNLQFRNRIKELTVTGMFDLFKNESVYINRVHLTPYAFIGATLFHHNPQAYVGEDSGLPEAGSWVDLKPLGTEGQNLDLPDDHPNARRGDYKRLQIAIPFGLGARYKLNGVMDISFEMAARLLFTDYIDDIGGSYVDVNLIQDPLAAYLSDRSAEVNDAVSGSSRAITSNAGIGFGTPNDDGVYNIRGGNKDDFYLVTTLRVTYIFGESFRKAKYR